MAAKNIPLTKKDTSKPKEVIKLLELRLKLTEEVRDKLKEILDLVLEANKRGLLK